MDTPAPKPQPAKSSRFFKIMAFILVALIIFILKNELMTAITIEDLPTNDPHAKNVLFIGNSFTFHNEMPKMFQRYAFDAGHSTWVKVWALSSYTLYGHLHDSQTRTALASRPWDYVILQEQSQKVAFDNAQFEGETAGPASQLVALVHMLAPHAKIYFFETWGYKNGDSDNCAVIPSICTYEGMQQQILTNVNELAVHNRVGMVRVGSAWQAYRSAHPEVELYEQDGKHPSVAGSELIAHTFADTLFAQ